MKLNFIILYVNQMDTCKRFYTQALGLTVVAESSSPTFVTLRAEGDAMLALQDNAAARFPPRLEKGPGSVELSFEVEDVDGTWKEWKEKGVELLTEPIDLPFGRYFMAKDPEGHYLSAYRFTR